MCGIIAVLRRRASRPPPTGSEVEGLLEQALAVELRIDSIELGIEMFTAAAQLEAVNRLLKGPPGVRCLLENGELAAMLRERLTEFERKFDDLERELDRGGQEWSVSVLEAINAGLVRLRDAAWVLRRDRLDAAGRVAALRGDARTQPALEAYYSIQTALAALDRLEVRGRDSAGLHVTVVRPGIDLTDAAILEPEAREQIRARTADGLFRNRSVRIHDDGARLSFVYKCAAEIGELGDNVAALRDAISGDDLLRRAVAGDDAEVTVLGHTRWASVGIISEANAHPLTHEEDSRSTSAPYVVAALNGDVDNHAALIAAHGLTLAPEITTDAKVIPCLVSRRLAAGGEPVEAFRRCVAEFDGSVAIGLTTADRPDELLLALRGSGQGLYIGMAEDAFIVASEPYGIIEETASYVRMEGESAGNPRNPTQSRGQIVRLTRERAGEIEGIERLAYDGTPLPVTEDDLTRAEITTRDVDRGSFRHYLLKEITEAPSSFRKTLRGKIREVDGQLRVHLGWSTLPEEIALRLRAGSIKRIVTIGQGTAAVASQGVARTLQKALTKSKIVVSSMPATELSGFEMRAKMGDTLVVAISQSGTTTDTNRTVDLVRARGAVVIAIVNRRGSDLTNRADGVLFTSDGRDVEMSVASTKAFYAQIAAGFLLAYGIAEIVGVRNGGDEHELLTALRELPDAMERTLGRRDEIREAARELVTGRRYWAIVGNGSNRIAAQELRIKLSELCYKSIACDATEDKKHIDLSSEPLILVCATGLTDSTANDVAKEIAIYRAHKALPIVIASEGEQRFDGAYRVIRVPRVHSELAFVLTTVVGHLFGYEAALAIDLLAQPLRAARAAIERHARDAVDGAELLEKSVPELQKHGQEFWSALAAGKLDGQLEASTATRLGSLLRYATGVVPLESFQLEHGKVGTPALVVDELTSALTRAIEELTRPVDAIKHQAKTVTVGISRSDEQLLGEPLIQRVLETGTAREHLGYSDLRALAALAPTIASIDGHTRYAISSEGDEIKVVGQGGCAVDILSRTATNPQLRGTKHLVVRERQLLVARGSSDDRTFIIVPEVDRGRTTGLVLLHATFRPTLDARIMQTALVGYRNRYDALVDAVSETEPTFREELLGSLSVAALLTEPVRLLADFWRSARKEV